MKDIYDDDPITEGEGDDCLFNLFIMFMLLVIFGVLIYAIIKS